MWSCDCGAVKKGVKDLNDVMREIVCPLCSSVLKDCSIPVQASLDSWLSLDREALDKKRKVIYEALLVKGRTDRELARDLGYDDPNKVRPRRKELVDMDLVRANIKRPCEVSNKNVTEWVGIS